MTQDLKLSLLETSALTRIGPLLNLPTGPAPQSTRGQPMRVGLDGPPLGADERGLVISVRFRVGRGSETTFRSRLDPQELRFSLLFWDRLDFPKNNVIGFDETAETTFLMGAGILTRSRVSLSGGNLAEFYIETHLNAFRALDARDASKWSLARGERSLGFRRDEVVPDRGVLLELHRVIPIPNYDVPLEDILEFKAKRAAELRALRHHLESLYLGIISSPDRAFAKTVALESIDKSISDVLKVGRESGIKFKLASFEAKLDILDFKQGGIAALAASQFGLPLSAIVIAGITGALAPSLSLSSGIGLKKRERSTNPFEYVSKFHGDLF